MRFLSCPNCKHRNNADAKFCNECGSQLRLTACPACGHKPTVARVICAGCGVHRAEESLLEVEPAHELPVLEDRLLEDPQGDVPVLKEKWPDSVTLLQPLPSNTVITQLQAQLPELPVVVTPKPARDANPMRRLSLGVMAGLAAAAAVLVAMTYLFQNSPAPAGTAVNVATPGPAPSGPQKPEPAPTSAAAATVALPAAPVTPSTNECSAAFAALGLCSDTSAKQETQK